jgi:hypothetical protein
MLIALASVGRSVQPAAVWNWPIAIFWVGAGAVLLLMAAALRQEKFKPHPTVLLVWGLWMLWIWSSTTWNRLDIQLDGTVIASQDVPPTRGPRYATEYTLRGPDGRDQYYVAGPTSDSLPRSMPIGTCLKKQRWQLFYERDGQRIDDWGFWSYGLFLCPAIGALYWSFSRWREERVI